jgi:UDP-N-acetylmuramate dehydrogenase
MTAPIDSIEPIDSAETAASTETPASTQAVRLSSLTTLRIGGPAARSVVATTTAELVDAVARADAERQPVLLVGGGSNLVVGDDGFDGVVIEVATRGIAADSVDYCGGAQVQVAAGEPWDGFVAHAVASGWIGVEALSGIPGSTGATPVQNVGAYGQEVAGAVASVRTWDRVDQRIRTLAGADCGFGYRDSLFKRERHRGGPRYVVLEVSFQLVVADFSEPVKYAELARTLGVAIGDRVPLADVRTAVLGLRRSKGMVLDDADHDTWSAGSFFTNPLLAAAAAADLPPDAPRWPTPEGRVKTSAAWLIEHAGFAKGYGLPGPASLSTKHTLALTNRGSASAADVLTLAGEIRDGVEKAFGVRLVPEPELINCVL